MRALVCLLLVLSACATPPNYEVDKDSADERVAELDYLVDTSNAEGAMKGCYERRGEEAQNDCANKVSLLLMDLMHNRYPEADPRRAEARWKKNLGYCIGVYSEGAPDPTSLIQAKAHDAYLRHKCYEDVLRDELAKAWARNSYNGRFDVYLRQSEANQRAWSGAASALSDIRTQNQLRSIENDTRQIKRDLQIQNNGGRPVIGY